jgi:hypothetical protein
MSDQIPLNFDEIKDALLEGLLTKSFEIDTTTEQEPEVVYSPAFEGVGRDLPLFDEEDRDILMHREAHFASNFDLMLQAYKAEDPSSVLDIDLARIYELKYLEEKLGKSLAPLVLHAQDAQTIKRVRTMYRLFQELLQEEKNPLYVAMAELILAEDPIEEVEKRCLELQDVCVSPLITIIQSDILYDPVYPGYGLAPMRAAHILGVLKADQAIPYLFYMLSSDTFDTQSAALQALKKIGEKAKIFCIEHLQSRPFSKSNELAAMALASFSCDDQIAQALIHELQDPKVWFEEPLVFYILASSEALPKSTHEAFYEILNNPSLPQEVRDEMQLITKMW